MTAKELTNGRQKAGFTQARAAAALGVSQPYLSQLEKGSRVVGTTLAQRAAALYGLSPTVLPLPTSEQAESVTPDILQRDLAGLGYPKFAHVPSSDQRNPAAVLYSAVVQSNLDTRLVEALPWVIGTYVDLDWPWLRDHVKLRNAQNRLGYLVHLAKEVS